MKTTSKFKTKNKKLSKSLSKMKQTEIGLIPEDWEVVELGSLIDIKHGFAFKGDFFTNKPNENVILTPGNFNIGGGFKSHKFKYYLSEYSEDYVLHEENIIVTLTDLSKQGDTLGYSAKIPFSKNKKYLHNQRLGLVKIKSDKAYPDFIYWLLRTKKYQKFVVGSATGSTVKHTSPNRICEYMFAFPPFEKQKVIAKILSDLDSKIEILQKQNETLEKIGQTIFKQWFVDFEFPNKKGKPYKSVGGKMIESELGKIPEGWGRGILSDIARIIGGGTPSTNIAKYYANNKIAWLTPRDFSGYKFKFISKGSRGITEEGLKNSSAVLISKGSIIFSSRAPIGYIAISSNELSTNQGFKSLVPHNSYFTDYLYFYIKKNTLAITNLASGSTFKEVSGTIMKNFNVIIPETSILKIFENFMLQTNQKLMLIQNEIKNLQKTRNLLLPKLMTGKIRVLLEDIK